MSEIKQFSINIDGKECVATAGDSILNVARANGINIPTLCDLKKLSPTGACRMCVVEQDNNIIASCKSYVTKPISVKTNTQRLQKYRSQIMSFLCINHPLECGVCDKSGECELQDKVLESKVDVQPFFALQKKNDFVHFSNKIYDESLCIVCERCARTCNEYVGNNVLSVLSGGFSSKIGVDFNAYCEDCDECVSVCPTGAMISDRFIYTSNAWELEKTPSHCLHCSMRCELFYEVKHNIDSKKEVYRIKNEAHIKQLCHAGRHNFMRSNRDTNSLVSLLESSSNNASHDNALITPSGANASNMDRYMQAILAQIDSIRLGIDCTNEEALLANMLASKYNKKLYCDDALFYRKCLSIVKSFSNKMDSNISHMLDNASVVINLGCYMFDEIPVLRSNLSKLRIKKLVKNIWINAIAESRFQSDLEIVYDVYSERNVAIVLLKLLCDFIQQEDIKPPFDIQKARAYIDSIDLGDVIAGSNISDYEIERLKELCFHRYHVIGPDHKEFIRQDKVVILVGMDFYKSSNDMFISHILGMLDSMDFIDVAIIPYGNACGIASICNLSKDSFSYEKVLAIRARAEYSISSFARDSVTNCSNKHISILPLQFVEGSFLDINGFLVKISPAYVDDDYTLSLSINSTSKDSNKANSNITSVSITPDLLDLLKGVLELDMDYLVELSVLLPFNNTPFDSLPARIYVKNPISLDYAKANEDLESYSVRVASQDCGAFVYVASLSGNLSFINSEVFSISVLKVSSQFAKATHSKDKDMINIAIGDVVIHAQVSIMPTLSGMVAVLVSDVVLDSKKYFDFKRV